MVRKKLPTIISKDEFERILKEGNFPKSNGKQFKLAFLLAFEAGMRISEIVGYLDRVPKLEREHVDLVRHQIKIVSGKGGKDRIVPLPKRINASVVKLLPLDISRRSLQFMITKMGWIVLHKKITFHTLRHGFGTHLAENDVPLHQIQMLMGHARLDTTGIYLHANPKRAIESARDLF